MRYFLLVLLAGIFLAACTEPQICGDCHVPGKPTERACFANQDQVEINCPGGLTQGGDASVDDGSMPTDEGTPDTSDGSKTDAHGAADAQTDAVGSDDAHIMTDAASDARSPPSDLGAGGSDVHVTPLPDVQLPDARVSSDARPNPDQGQPCDPRCGVQCQPNPEVCNGIDDNCDEQTDEGVTNACGGCGALPREICDGEDNNCDGRIDEGMNCACSIGDNQACYSGNDPNTEGVGLCHAGTQFCEFGIWGFCENETTPSPEVCNRIDDNCNSQVDDVLHFGELCLVQGQRGACAQGHLECDGAVNGQLICISDRVLPVQELCGDLVDNDCDGEIDGDSCAQRPDAVVPTNDVALADAAPPSDMALPDATPDAFTPPPDAVVDAAVPPPDAGPSCIQTGLTDPTCDGVDDDCNGQVDDGYIPSPTSCGVGACAAVGQNICQDGVEIDTCTAGNPTPEVCDQVDNDCNDQVDNGLGLGNACEVGVGACLRTGVRVCGMDSGVTCSVQAGQATPETCNNIDDNCDGQIDSGITCPTWTVAVGSVQATVTKVTKAQYRSCVEAGACIAPNQSEQPVVCNWQEVGRDDHPLNCVVFAQATQYCQWLGGGANLPTNEEWNAVAGGTARVYTWGLMPAPDCTRVHYLVRPVAPQASCAPFPQSTRPASDLALSDSPVGARQMLGNVREWTRTAAVNNQRLVKGGGYLEDPRNINWTLQRTDNTNSIDLGFRCVRPELPNP